MTLPRRTSASVGIFGIVLVAIASSLVPLGRAVAAEVERVGEPFAGTVGFRRSVADMMREEAALGGAPRELQLMPEHEGPEREGLPQNPDSPNVPGFPIGRSGPEAQGEGPVEAFSPQTLGPNFTAATLQGVNPTFAFPPDDMGAVGPSQYIVEVNGRIVTFNKTTGAADGVLNTSTDVFFNPVRNGSGTSDPRIRYDRLSGRWFLLIINVSTPNRILIAVSDAASAGVITGGTVWTEFFIRIDTTPPGISSTCLADYPTLGIDANALYVGTNNFCGSPSQVFNSTDGFVIRKSSILGAGPIIVTVFRGLVPSASSAGPYTPQGVDNYDPASNEGYFIGVDNVSFGKLMFRRVSNPGGTPSVSSNISITVPTTSFPISVRHLGNTGGTNGRLDALDDRLFAAHLRNGRLWTAHNINVDNTGTATGSASRDGSRWYELSVPVGSGTPTVVQSGTVFSNAGTQFSVDQRNYWIPSVMVTGQGHAALGFSTAGTNERVNAATVGRLSGDALGTMRTPLLYTNSGTSYNPPSDPGARGARRWGDYSYTSVDPLDDMSMWTVEQFCDANNSYGVRVVKLVAPLPASPSALPDVLAGMASVSVTLTGTSSGGTGYFDPGANLPGVPAYHHLAVAASSGAATGTPPTVVSATYVNPTTINLVLNSQSATANLAGQKYTVTVTNPDGQTAAAAVLHVVAATVSVGSGPTQNEGDAGATTYSFPVTLSTPVDNDVTVFYQTVDGSAKAADGDYQAATSSLTIPAHTTTGTINVDVLGDTKRESDETFSVTLTSATSAAVGSPATGSATLVNDDPIPTLSIGDVTLAEGNAGPTAFDFAVTLSNATDQAVTVHEQTSDGSALVADSDYQGVSATFTIPANALSATATIVVNGDAKCESDETFVVDLSSPVNATIVDGQGQGTIQTEDVGGPTTTTLQALPNPAPCGGKVTVTAHAAPVGTTGTVEFYEGATLIGTGAVGPLTGDATLSLAGLAVGNHELTAKYLGDGCYEVSESALYSQDVVLGPTSVVLQVDPSETLVGEKVLLTAQVSPAGATGTVQFCDGASPIGSPVSVDGSGQATLSVTDLPVGTHSLIAKYSGDGCYAPSQSAPVSHVVHCAASSVSLASDVNPSACGQSVTLTATVSPVGATGTVEFYEGVTLLGTGPVSPVTGIATFSLSSLPVGTHVLEAKYVSDGCYRNSQSAPYDQVVVHAGSAVALGAAPAKSICGEKVQLTAQVSPAGATGTVQFCDGASPIGSPAPVDGSGQATLSVTGLTVGAHSLIAKYSGDGCYQPSESAPVAHEVNPAPSTVSLTSDVNPAKQGTKVSLIAQVGPAGAVGTVTFVDGTTPIGDAPLDGSGMAILSVTNLPVGKHDLVAKYSGDACYAPSESAPYSLVIFPDNGPVAHVISPNGGEDLVVGTDVKLSWEASDDNQVVSVTLGISRDNGGSYETIATDVANTGTFTWTVSPPGTNSGPTPLYSALFEVTAKDNTGQTGSDASDAPFSIFAPPTAAEGSELPSAFALGRAWPNPTRGALRAEYSVPVEADVRLTLVDVTGREVALLASGSHAPGRYIASWNGRTANAPAPTGIYFLRYATPGRTLVKRLAVTR